MTFEKEKRKEQEADFSAPAPKIRLSRPNAGRGGTAAVEAENTYSIAKGIVGGV